MKRHALAILFACSVCAFGFQPVTSLALVPLQPPKPIAGWPQMAHDAQRTGYTPVEPKLPWRFAWHWKPNDMYSMPNGLHIVTGDGKVYVPGGDQGLYAVNLANGKTAWRFDSGHYIEEAAAFDINTQSVLVGDHSGRVYRLDAKTGKVQASYQADSAIRTGVLLVDTHAYITTEAGKLHKIEIASMSQVWIYDAGVKAVTAASYSPSRRLLIFGTADLTVHAVNESDGSRKWAKKPPTPHSVTPCGLGSTTPADKPYSYQYGFPVIAESVGVVFIRMRLGEGSTEWLWAAGPKGRFPTTNAGIKRYLRENRNLQPLFALSLDSGNEAFIPAVGNGGIDSSFAFDCGNVIAPGVISTIGPMPVVKTFPDGSQAAYIQFRNGDVQDKEWDGRWDSHPGEMILSPLPGWQIGDMRFIPSPTHDTQISDEQGFGSMAGNTYFINHWMTINPITITDRSPRRGRMYAQPLGASFGPIILRRARPVTQVPGGSNPRSRYFPGPIASWCDGRWYDSEGFWMYWKQLDPPTQSPCNPDGTGPGYGDAHRPRYTVVSDGYILVVGHGGDVFALRHAP